MPNLNEIAAIADALEKCPVVALQDRCVVVRNRNASCRKCKEACKFGAIDISGNELTIDPHSCVGCGACVAVCPSEVLVHRESSAEGLQAALADAQQLADGMAVIACARAASKRKADPSRYAEVPCLAVVSEEAVVSAVGQGARSLILVDGNCKTCKYGAIDELVSDTVSRANALLGATESPVRALRQSTFPEEVLADSPQSAYGSTRRGFFSEAVGAAKSTALTAAKASLDERLGGQQPVEIGERLRVTESGTLPLLNMPRHEAALNALYDLGASNGDVLSSRLFANVEIDTQKCNACGMCVTFCPTGALSRPLGESPKEKLRSIEFSASDCVQCRLCSDVCWKGCLTLHEEVRADQLFDFEPRAFDLKSCRE